MEAIRLNVIYSCTDTIDAAGRVTQEAISPTQNLTAPVAVAMTFDADNRLASYNGSPVSFDADGNMQSGRAPGNSGLTNSSYTSRNQLAEAAAVGHSYGVEGRRTGLQSFDGTSTAFVADPSAGLDRVL